MTNNIVGIAQEIYEEIGEASGFSISAITQWLRRNIGGLNTNLNQNFEVDGVTFEITPALSDIEKYIFKKMYFIYYFDVQIRTTGSTSDFMSVRDDYGTVTRSSKNELLRNYVSIRRQEYDELKQLIAQYRNNNSSPLQVAGDDTIPGFYNPRTLNGNFRSRQFFGQ